MRHGLLALLLLCVAGVARADDQAVPYLSGRVNDNAGILSSSTISRLEQILKAEEDSTSNQIAVLTINTLDGGSLEDYSMKVVETWKLGKKGKDNGVLLLVVKDDRKVRIEVGYGLEGVLTDAVCNTIIRRAIIPEFKSGDYDAGVTAGVENIIAAIGGEFQGEGSSDTDGGPVLVTALVILMVIASAFGRLARRGIWFGGGGFGGFTGGGFSSGGFGGGFGGGGGFSGGGGGFGGGGSSGSW